MSDRWAKHHLPLDVSQGVHAQHASSQVTTIEHPLPDELAQSARGA